MPDCVPRLRTTRLNTRRAERTAARHNSHHTLRCHVTRHIARTMISALSRPATPPLARTSAPTHTESCTCGRIVFCSTMTINSVMGEMVSLAFIWEQFLKVLCRVLHKRNAAAKTWVYLCLRLRKRLGGRLHPAVD